MLAQQFNVRYTEMHGPQTKQKTNEQKHFLQAKLAPKKFPISADGVGWLLSALKAL